MSMNILSKTSFMGKFGDINDNSVIMFANFHEFEVLTTVLMMVCVMFI